MLINILIITIILITCVYAQYCGTPIQLVTTMISGACVNDALPAQYKIFTQLQLGSLDGMTRYSFSVWFRPKYQSGQDQFSIFRLTTDTSDDTPLSLSGVRLGLFFTTDPINPYYMKIGYAKGSTPLYYQQEQFNFLINYWVFAYLGLDTDLGTVSYFFWQPKQYPIVMLNPTPLSEVPSFNTPLNFNGQVELLYWGQTYKRFCGDINNFYYYPNFLETSNLHNMFSMAFMTPTSTFTEIARYRLEDQTGTTAADSIGTNHGTVSGATWTSIGAQFQTAQKITLPKFTFTNANNAWGISFWLKINCVMNADADTTDALIDSIVFSRVNGGSFRFQIEFYKTTVQYSIKLRINNIFYNLDSTFQFNINTWQFLSIRLAYTNAVTELTNIIFDVLSGNTQGYYNTMISQTTAYSETAGDVLTLGSSSNDITGKFELSHVAFFQGFSAYQDITNLVKCASDCQISNNILGQQYCSMCGNSKFLLSGQCLTNCPISAYGVENSVLQVCQTCNYKCSACDASNQCTACKTSYFLNNATKQCGLASACQTSPSLHVGNPTTRVCTQCGNSLVDSGEECDDGNFNNNDGCTNCVVDSGYVCSSGSPNVCVLKCGNGKREAGEECDDQNYVSFDGCSNCAIDLGYQCTGGSPTTKDTCIKICGNGKRDGTEVCDDGNLVLGDGCSNCKIDKGWVCLGGTASTPDTCTKLCGNAKRDFGEECDDGDAISGNGCSDCGIDAGYYCINGSPTTPDQCFKQCGNGLRDYGEQCDDNNVISNDGCTQCNIDNDYVCVGGSSISQDVCSLVPSICGDGKKKSTESCDDGNVISGDGCSSTCHIEYGFLCKGGSLQSRDICTEICGDGKRVGKEQCDDGNSLGGDGCNELCKIENQYSCTGGNITNADTCLMTCGNGQRESNEECDDENQNIDDGCSAECTIEIGYGCMLFAGTTRDTCFKCIQGCTFCANKTLSGCLYCQSGFYRSELMQQCVNECPAKYYPEHINQNCQPCFDQNCIHCNDGQEKSCTVCSGEHFILDGQCFSICPSGFYFLRSIFEQNKQCATCPFPCSVCFNATRCTDCADFYYLDNNFHCQLCGLGEQCTKCDQDKSTCKQCIAGFLADGKGCKAIPDKCGDGLISQKEQCDDDNTDDGDGCSSSCQIESQHGCLSVNIQGPSECYFKGPPVVSIKLSKAYDDLLFIKFNRHLNNAKYDNLKKLVKIKIVDYDRRKYNYSVIQKNLDTFSVSFEFADTVRNQKLELNFTEPTKIIDKYNYSLSKDFQPITADMAYYIYYSDAEKETAQSLGQLALYGQIFFFITMFYYLKVVGQGRCWKYVEILQVVAAIRFLNLKFDLNSEYIFKYLYYLTFNFVYNPFTQIPLQDQDNLNIEEDTARLQKISYSSYFLQNSLGRALVVLAFVMMSKFVLPRVLLLGRGEIFQLTLEFLQKEYKYNIFLKTFDLLFLDLCIGVCFAISNIYLNTILAIVNAGLAVLTGIGLLFFVYTLYKRFVKNEGITKNMALYNAFNSLYDGILIKKQYNRLFMITSYLQKILMAMCLAFLQNIPIIQVSVYIFIRALPLIAIFLRNPFQFSYIRNREFVSEGFAIALLGIIYKISDPFSPKDDLVMIGYIMFVLLIFYEIYFSYLNYWVVKQDDLELYPPEQVVAPKVTEEQKEDLQKQQVEKIKMQRKQTKLTTQKIWNVDNGGTNKTSENNLKLDTNQKEDIFEDQKQNLSTNRLTNRPKSNKPNINVKRLDENDVYEQDPVKKKNNQPADDEYEYEDEEDDPKNQEQNNYFQKYAKDI